jgi:UDP-2-acetamido-2,6-beta-L-arabino-hexul-4-ose reductase
VIERLVSHEDERGSFVTVVKTDEYQVAYSTTAPWFTRGNHYHLRKWERFVVVSGTAVLEMRDRASGKRSTHLLFAGTPQSILVPPNHTHKFINCNDKPLVVLIWCSEPYDPGETDTYAEDV